MTGPGRGNPSTASSSRSSKKRNSIPPRKRIVARTVTIKVRYGDFTTVTRSHSDVATNAEEAIVRRAVALLEKTEAGVRPVRLLGAGVHNLESLDGAADTAEVEGPQLRFEA